MGEADHDPSPNIEDWSQLSDDHLLLALEGKSFGKESPEMKSKCPAVEWETEECQTVDEEMQGRCSNHQKVESSVPHLCSGGMLRDLFHLSSEGSQDRLEGLSGVGPALARRLLAAHEVGRRSHAEVWHRKDPFLSSRQVYRHLVSLWQQESREHFCLLLLDVRHRLIRECVISIGSLTASIVHPREVFRPAVIHSAAAMILAHNHPSGDPEPSDEDLRVTRRLHRCGQWMGIPVLDHVISGRGEWCSLRDMGIGPWDPSEKGNPGSRGISANSGLID